MADKIITKYGARWKSTISPLAIEIQCVQHGGQWIGKQGQTCGLGLFHHYKAIQQLCWPDDYHHRWSDLMLSEILNNTITVLSGPKDTGKTYVGLSRFALTDYFCFPDETLIILSSTDMRSLELRVWGDVKKLWQRAKELWPELPGNMIDTKHCITTDDLEDDKVIARDLRKGIICVPCKTSSGHQVNISSYVGIKQKRRRHMGDEFQFMAASMLDAIANANSGEWKGVYAGNPIGQGDPLDRISEPKCGWDQHPEPQKTVVWDNKMFAKSRTICLYGPDSPNFDQSQVPYPKYEGLICQDSIDRLIAGYGKDSHQYYSQALGVRKSGIDSHRVITANLCEENHAFDPVDWDHKGDIVRIAALDAAYGGIGGDRCVGGWGEFGKATDGSVKLLVHPPEICRMNIRLKISAEDQITAWCKEFCERRSIPPENFFYDAGMRTSLCASMAKNWNAQTNPIDFGGVPTDRPVSLDMYVYDMERGGRRLKTCKEHYSKFVTELWWSSRYAIESGQIRGLDKEVAREGYMREWKQVKGDKIELETKSDMKSRMGYSPDLYDWFVTLLEGARRKGFSISRLSNGENTVNSVKWLRDLARQSETLRRAHSLNYAV